MKTRSRVIRYFRVVALLLLAPALSSGQCTPTNQTGCAISPATLEVNLGALPVDLYTNGSMNTNRAIIPSCDASTSVRACIQSILANYHSQGATGVRFFFGLGGGGYSTPFTTHGHGLKCWLANLSLFLQDVRDAGYTHVTPTPVLVDAWSAKTSHFYTDTDSQGQPIYGCNQKAMRFLPWLPFGLEKWSGEDPGQMIPDCGHMNNGYNAALNNTYNFWGWGSFFNLMDYVLWEVQAHGLKVEDFDIQNELDLFNFTVEARLIYDNKNSVDVVGGMQQKMAANFGEPYRYRVTFSTQAKRPKKPEQGGYDCESYYQNDSAMIVRASELYAAFNHQPIGTPTGVDQTNNIPCGGSQATDMVTLPTQYAVTQPTVTNIHAHVCYAWGSSAPQQQPPGPDDCVTGALIPDATDVANTLYSKVWTYIHARNLDGNKLVFGEVNHTQAGAPDQCLAYYNVDRAYNNVNGLTQSTLYTDSIALSTRQNTVLRVWQDISRTCYTVPNPIKPPYGTP